MSRAGTGPELTRRQLSRLAAGAAITLSCPAAARTAQEPFLFGLTPVFLSNDLELLSSLRAYLAAKLDMPVELVTRRTYQEVTALLVSGRLHSAWICGYPYVQHRDELTLVAAPLWRGKPLYQSYLIVSSDRVASDWRDLEGDIHAFSDPDSNSGYLVTQALLTGHERVASSFFSHSFFTYGHRNVIRAVAAGLAHSGSVDGYVWEVMRESEPDLVLQTKIVGKSEWLGFPPIAAPRSATGEALIARLSDALISMHQEPEGRRVLDLLRLSGFTRAEPSLFEPIADKVRKVGRVG